MSFIVILIGLGYAMLLLCLAMPVLHYQPAFITRKKYPDQKKLGFSIIVTYRNERNQLPKLLASLSDQDYDPSLLEFCFVNDGSTDGSQEWLTDFSRKHPSMKIHLLERVINSNSAKKDGITQAIAMTSFDYIMVTDADCVLPKTWAASFNQHYQNYAHAMLVAGPVNLPGSGFLAALQQLEMIALQTITAGGFALRRPFMCNGANLSFKKEAFLEVDGYEGNDHLSSGDDVFLLEKLAAEDVLQCHYLKDNGAVVETQPKSSWSKMLEQRARWARKGTQTKSMLNKLVAFHVAAASILFLLLPFFWYFNLISSQVLISFYLLKFFADFIVLVVGNQFLKMEDWLKYFLPQFFLYPLVVIGVGFRSLGKIQWSNRPIDQSSLL